MKITVVHEVPNSTKHCSDGDSGGWYINCIYYKYRDKTGKNRSIERGLPRCTLFNEWLKKDMHRALKCEACLKAGGNDEI